MIKRFHIQLELTDYCNIDCIMCCVKAAGDGFRRRATHGFMNFEIIEKLIDDFENIEAETKELTIPWAGEATVHPDFEKIISLFLKRDFCHINLVTNGILLKEKLLDTIMDSCKLRKHRFNILFSLDAATEETYLKIKRGNFFKKVINNINSIIKIRKRLNLKYPTLLIQFILMEENIDEMENFEFLSRKLLNSSDYYRSINNDSIDVTRDGYNIRVIGYKGDSETEDRNKLLKKLGINTLTVKPVYDDLPCATIFENINIHWSGTATFCCNDLGLKFTIGSFPENSLLEIFNSKRMNWIRDKHLAGERRKITLCKNCLIYRSKK